MTNDEASRLTPLRKAAILLASLDDETSDELLEQMEPEQAARVRREIVALNDIDPALQQQIVAEFRRSQSPPRDPYPTGIELDSGLAERIACAESRQLHEPSDGTAEEPPPFRFLHQAEADTLVDYLKNERPQTIALVVSYLSPAQAAEVVDRLAPVVQAQVLRRLTELDSADPAVLRDVERQMESWISQQTRNREKRRAGLEALSAIVSAAERNSRQQIISNLSRHDKPLAESLGFHVTTPEPTTQSSTKASTSPPLAPRKQRRIRFSSLMDLADERLAALVEAAQTDVLVLALAGANATFVERVANCLTARQARLLRRALKHLGPTRLSDVEEAQETLAGLADELFTEQTDDLLSNRRVALAA
ncbi:MAG TPA: FliG C-terminal domain-containing protein [Pirellulales bacterium]|nr:FliG C-terminal domain-containing protein [Pirellulales bacterium]